MARNYLKPESKLLLQGTDYTIESVCGAGSNSVVYCATYADNVSENKMHRVLIKELFPFEPSGKIFRDDNGLIRYDDAEDLFALHKESFLHGNNAHLELLMLEADSVGGNINSFEANNTYYTVLPYNSTKTLEQRIFAFPSLSEKLMLISRLIDALSSFHKHGMLHLDVSPDNVLLSEHENSILKEMSVLLIDYNSVWDLEELSGHEGIYFSVKEHYTAPEVRLRDQRSIGTHSDLFSVSAILFEIITGKKIENEDIYNDLRGKADKLIAESMQGYPQSVKYKLNKILHKGLKIVPKMRYKSCEEMLSDINDLQKRIDRRGVTASSLWECAGIKLKSKKSLYKDTEIIPNEVRTASGEFEDALEFAKKQCEQSKNIWIFGDGGFGKTTLLYRLASDMMKKYNDKAGIFHYISLSGYNDETNPNYIKDSLTIGIRAENSVQTVEDTRRALVALLRSGEIRISVLLDGFNEINTNPQTLVREIVEMSKYPGCNFVITSRSNDTGIYSIENFSPTMLCALPLPKVRDCLASQSLQIAEQNDVLFLLTNPLMLQMYIRSLKIRRDLGEIGSASVYAPHDGKSLIRGYIESLMLSEEKNRTGDKIASIRTKYILYFFLPLLANRADASKIVFTKEELLNFAEENFNLLQSKAFSHTFPEYAGKSRDILFGIRTGAEWFDLSIQETAIKKFRLLYESEGLYYFSHEILYSALSEDGIRLSEGLKKYKRLKRLPKIITAVVSLIAILFITAAVLTFKVLPDKSAKLAEEAKSCFESGDRYAAAEYALKSVELLLFPHETDPGVVALRSIMADDELRNSTSTPHKDYTIQFPAPNVAYYGTTSDKTKVVFGDTACYWICDNTTGKILEKKSFAEKDNIFKDIPEQKDPENPFLLEMENVLTEPIENLSEYSEKKEEYCLTIFGKNGQKFTVKGEEKPKYILNSNCTAVTVLCDGYFYYYLLDGSFSQKIHAPLGYEIKKFCISPKGNYIFSIAKVEIFDSDNDESLMIFEVSSGQRIDNIKYSQKSTITSIGVAFPQNDEEAFYVFEDESGTMSKYVYNDEIPSEKQKYSALTENIEDAIISKDGKIAYTYIPNYTNKTQAFLFSNPDTGEKIRCYSADNLDYIRCSISEDLRFFAICDNLTVEFYDIYVDEPIFRYIFDEKDLQIEKDEPFKLNNVWIDYDSSGFICSSMSNKLFYFRKTGESFSKSEIFLPEGIDIMEVTADDENIYVGVYMLDTAKITEDETICNGCTLVYTKNELKISKVIPVAFYDSSNITRYDDIFNGKYMIANADGNGEIHIYDTVDDVEIKSDYEFGDCVIDQNNELIAMRELYLILQGSVEINVMKLTPEHTMKKLYSYNPEEESEYYFIENGKYLFIATESKTIILDALTGEEVLNLPNIKSVYKKGEIYQFNSTSQYPVSIPHITIPSMNHLKKEAREQFNLN